MNTMISPPKTNDIYAINATILDIQPLRKLLLTEMSTTAKTKKPIPANDTHIFIIESICLTPCIRTN